MMKKTMYRCYECKHEFECLTKYEHLQTKCPSCKAKISDKDKSGWKYE